MSLSIGVSTPNTPLVESTPETSQEETKQHTSPHPTNTIIYPSGHEQRTATLLNLLLCIASVAIGVIFHASSCAQIDWMWYVVTSIQTLLCFLLPVLYPGFAVFKYTLGLGNDGPATRFEAFYIESTLGMMYGISHMAFLDHFLFLFAPCVVLLSWMPSVKCQVFASALTCICGLYMTLWIPTNVATSTTDYGPYVLSTVLIFCSFARVCLPSVAYDTNFAVTLLAFQGVLCIFLGILLCRGIERRKEGRAIHSIKLTNWLCCHIGDGPVWQSWPMIEHEETETLNISTATEEGRSSSSLPFPNNNRIIKKIQPKEFPSGWWFEPTPFGNKTCFGDELDDFQCWPYGDWPSHDTTALCISITSSYSTTTTSNTNKVLQTPPPSIISNAQEEMLREMPEFIPSILIMICLFMPLLGLLLALTIWL